jgi:divalent metal cation (Fe/Co/Zn/Cd) transporter
MSSELNKKALLLSYFTVGYNVVEGIISIIFGLFAGSVALVGFGLDSFVESLSGSVMIWRFRKHEEMTKEEEERAEKKAIKLIGCAFLIMSAYILYESIRKLVFQEIPEPSVVGIVIAILSLIIMPFLTYLKYKTGKDLDAKSLVADSKQTLACVFLSVALLIGLGLNYSYGIWQADPLVGLVVVVFLMKEGYTALKEEKLCSC